MKILRYKNELYVAHSPEYRENIAIHSHIGTGDFTFYRFSKGKDTEWNNLGIIYKKELVFYEQRNKEKSRFDWFTVELLRVYLNENY